jgi:EamA-like transporter family.
VGRLVLLQRRGAAGTAAADLVLLRVALASIFLLPLLWVYRIRFPKGLRAGHRSSRSGCFNNVLPFSLIVMGQTYIPSGLASILNATTPLFTVIVMAAAGGKAACAADRGRDRWPDRRSHPPWRRI